MGEWNARSLAEGFGITSQGVRFASESRQVTTEQARRQCVYCPNLPFDGAPHSMPADETQLHHETEVR
jgi:hypothetical protein